mgnify:CR=1 FL=1
MTTGNDNRQDRSYTITVERWNDPGDLNGCYLVSLIEAGRAESIDGGIFGSKDEAYDFARDLMKTYPSAVFHDQSEEG